MKRSILVPQQTLSIYFRILDYAAHSGFLLGRLDLCGEVPSGFHALSAFLLSSVIGGFDCV